jgi:hypothetical protein
MASNETQICNQALERLGSSRILSLEDATAEARFCKLFYPATRDEVLRSHRWNFATKRTVLSRLSDAPIFGWSVQYQLPIDFLRLLQLNRWRESEARSLHEIEGNKLLTNEQEGQLKYIARVTDANLFDALFIEALALKLASKLAKPLTNSNSLHGEFLQEYERVTAPLARRIDAQEDRPKRFIASVHSNLVASRFGSVFRGGGSAEEPLP